MKRKILAFFLILSFIFSFSSCGADSKKSSKNAEATTKKTVVTAEKNKEKEEKNTESDAEDEEKENEDTKEETKEEKKTETKNEKSNEPTVKQNTQTPATTAHTHNYSIFVKTVDPTTTERGYDVYKCSCGATTKANYKDVIKNTTFARNYTKAQEFLNALNSYRSSVGAPPLAMEGFMQEYAMQRAMELKNNFSHNGASGDRARTGCPIVQDKYGDIYKYAYAGENIGNVLEDVSMSEALNRFKNSPDHNSMQINPKWTQVGIGVAEGWGGVTFIAVEFYYETHLCFD